MYNYIEKNFERFNEIIEFLKKELGQIKTGRANPSIIEDIMIEAYGTKTSLKQLASLSVPEARVLVVSPWDKNITKEVEKSLTAANIGLSIVNEGAVLRLIVPQLTEESRKDLVKKVNEKLEQSKIKVRQLRDEIKEEIIKAEKNKEISEDDKFKAIEELDKTTREHNDKIKEIGEKKEEEIMTV